VLRVPTTSVVSRNDSRKVLIDRIAASRFISKSARLHDLLIYLCDRVIHDRAEEIHEQEVGFRVFGRPRDYDTASDNIVRVHASTLRKRLEQYFATDGLDEPIVIEIPKGNYAPIFRERPIPEPVPIPDPAAIARPDARVPFFAALAVLFACSTVYLLLRPSPVAIALAKPSVHQFWSSVFPPGDRRTDIVLDDAAVGLYQELSGHAVPLSDYFDRSYLRKLIESPPAGLNPDVAGAIVRKRQTGIAGTMFLLKLWQAASPLDSRATLHFAREYSFRELKANNAVLLGNTHSNPWIEPFESHFGLRWRYDPVNDSYQPVDTWAEPAARDRFSAQAGEAHEGYCMMVLLPNLSGSGSVLIVSGTGGSAVGAAGDFLSDEKSVAQLRSQLPPSKTAQFPYFEALIRIKSRTRFPRDASIAICRSPRTL
jgi:hypothetical protein